MPRIYEPPMVPSSNKAVKPVQEVKTSKSGGKENVEKAASGEK